MRKWLKIAVVLMAAALVVFGFIVRRSFRNVLEEYIEQGKHEDYTVNFVLNDHDSSMFEQEEGMLDKARYIVKAKVLDGPEERPSAMQYRLEIEEVYRGEGMKPGQKIRYVAQQSKFSYAEKAFYGCFTNLMLTGRQYLVFLDVPAMGKKDIYLSPEDSYFQYFSFDEHENAYDPKEYKQLGRRYYLKTVKNNEFFVQNKKALEDTLEFKEKIFKKYGIRR